MCRLSEITLHLERLESRQIAGGIHSECRARRRFRGYMSRSLCDNNHRLSQLQSSRHVDSVGRDQLRIRHFGTQLDLLEASLFFRLGEKRQQVLASQPVG